MSRDTVLIRWAHLADPDAVDVDRLETLLDDTERARASRFAFPRDRLSYVAAHALIRSQLSIGTDRLPSDWRFSKGEHGRPEIIADQNTRGCRFNISHTAGFVAVALTLERDVGIDVEARQRRGLTIEIADRFFAPAETAHLLTIPVAGQREVFMTYWTLKEAYIKAVGKGLALPLDGFAFTLDPLAISFTDRIDDHADAWVFRRFSPTPDHLMAVAVRHPRPAGLVFDVAPVDLSDIA